MNQCFSWEWCPGSEYDRVLLQDGTTPVYIASQNGHVDVLRVLVDCKADVNRATEVTFFLSHTVSTAIALAPFVCVSPLIPRGDWTGCDRVRRVFSWCFGAGDVSAGGLGAGLVTRVWCTEVKGGLGVSVIGA
jgi:hypothetical protein